LLHFSTGDGFEIVITGGEELIFRLIGQYFSGRLPCRVSTLVAVVAAGATGANRGATGGSRVPASCQQLNHPGLFFQKQISVELLLAA
jgi:hypothetical protein